MDKINVIVSGFFKLLCMLLKGSFIFIKTFIMTIIAIDKYVPENDDSNEPYTPYEAEMFHKFGGGEPSRMAATTYFRRD